MVQPVGDRILVRLPNWVGDVVMATPALRALRRAFPAARITGALKAPADRLLAGTPLLDDVLVLEGREERIWSGAWSLARRLRKERFDCAIFLTNSLTSVIPACLARIPRRVGYSGEARGWLLTDSRPPERDSGRRRPMPMPDYYQRVLELLEVPFAGARYELPVDERDREASRRILTELGWDGVRPLLGVNPGASFGPSKLWPTERLAQVARELEARHGLQPVMLCGPQERALAAELAAAAGASALDTSARFLDLAELRGFMQLMTLLITTDAGPRHVAVAYGKPVVVLMGPTHPTWTAWNLERTRVLRHDVPCGPCHLKTCPTDHACMDRIGVLEVLHAAEDLLSTASAESEAV